MILDSLGPDRREHGEEVRVALLESVIGKCKNKHARSLVSDENHNPKTPNSSCDTEIIAGVHSSSLSTEGVTTDGGGGGGGGSSDTTGPSLEAPNLSSRSDSTKKMGSKKHRRVGDTRLQLPTSVQSPERTAKSPLRRSHNNTCEFNQLR